MREGRIRTHAVALAACDTLMVLLAMQIAWWLRFDVNHWLYTAYGLQPFGHEGPDAWTPYQPYLLAVFITLPLFWLILREMGLYAQPEDGAGEFFRLGAAVLVASVLLAAMSFYVKQQHADQQFQYSRGYMLLFVPTSIVCLAVGRYVCRALLRALSLRGVGQNRLLFVGTGPLAEELARALGARGTNHVIGMLTSPEQPPLTPRESARPAAAQTHVGPLPQGERDRAAHPVTVEPTAHQHQESHSTQGRGAASQPSPLEGEGRASDSETDKPFVSCEGDAGEAGVSRARFGVRGYLAAPILGSADDLVELAAKHQCDEVIVALPDAAPGVLRKLAEDCYRAHVRFRMVPDIYEMLLDHMDLTLVDDIPLLGMRGSRIEGINFLCKRLFDILVSGVLLALFLIPFLFTIIAIKWNSPGPAFYFQERMGYRRRKFRFWKFRTMKVGADAGAQVEQHRDYLKKYIAGNAEGAKDAKGRTVYKLTQDPRVTPLGRFLRQYSIDELPQLWNVLKGDMSLIGPRPPIAYEVEAYRPIHLRRFEVLPGISGLWQVSGRNQLTFEEMIKLDLYYIENWSLELDVRILFKTISVVLFQRAH